MSIKEYLVSKKDKLRLLFDLLYRYREIKLKLKTCHQISNVSRKNCPVVYYCGIPVHGNLGDLAQGVCIRKWIKKNYPDHTVAEIETNSIVNTRYSCLGMLKRKYNNKRDFVVFQSGYTTTDLGGFADPMHQAVINALPEARILMMPQTIFFKSEERKQLCSKVYDSHKKMLFLARDKVSFGMAKEMFPSLPKTCYPDIVTTLIGTVDSNQDREGIMFCLRNDGEKYYSDEELAVLIDRCKDLGPVKRTDTTKGKSVIQEAEKYIYAEISEYAKYKVVVTDRYHGTILSLVAGTPVIIIQTTDHKVTTGADWFKGVYDDYVYLAENLDEAYQLTKELYFRHNYETLKPFFEENYYDKLPALFAEIL